MIKYVSEVNESVRDARRQLIGYLLERDKAWFEKSCEQYQEERESPRRKRHQGATKKKGKETQLSGAAEPREHHADIGIFDTAAKGYLSELEKTLEDNDINSALFKAVQKNWHGIVAALADRGTDINAYNEMQYTPLLLACETGKAECAEVLIEKGANLGIKTPASDTALHLAVRAGAASINNLLLHKGMEANVTNQADETPLHIAALHSNGALVGPLVSAGAKINAVTKEFVTPLHTQLLHHKANVNCPQFWITSRDGDPTTPCAAVPLQHHSF
uniref:Uncharacterized protein n=1 Tax=Pavo cristatus TaxID=9049 RepID=A0A8C9EXH7_PAVCR